MKLGFKIHILIMKLSFSAVLLQLFAVSYVGELGLYTPSYVSAMLEYCSASAVCALGAGLFMEYILNYYEK